MSNVKTTCSFQRNLAPQQCKIFFGAIFLIFCFFVFASKVLATDVVINEFLPHPSSGSDWIELYNSGSEAVSISDWVIEDTTSTVKTISEGESISAAGFYYFTVGNRLNNGGDNVILKDNNGSEKDSKSYEADPGIDISLGRQPDGGSWTTFSSPTPGSSNGGTSSPSLSSSPSPSPSSSDATYKINEVKDEDSNTLSNVEVYVDDVYLHHYAPETLTFCDGCQCDTYVDCGFGEHTIKLEKNGYEDWSETKTINSGDNFEANPIMSLSDSSSSSSPSPSPSPKVSPSPSPGSTASVQSQTSKEKENKSAFEEESALSEEMVLGVTESSEQKEKEKETEKGETGFLPKLPFLLIPGGIILLFIANFQTLKPKIQDVIELIKYKLGH